MFFTYLNVLHDIIKKYIYIYNLLVIYISYMCNYVYSYMKKNINNFEKSLKQIFLAFCILFIFIEILGRKYFLHHHKSKRIFR